VDADDIRALLASIEGSDAIPTPPGMRAIPVAMVIDGGAEQDEAEAWVKEHSGWLRRMPPHFLPPEATERDALFFVVVEKALEGGPAAVAATLPSSDCVAFVATASLARARAFYEKALGLKVTGESPIAVTFDANGTTVRTVLVERPVIAPYTTLGWTVADISASVRELTSRGVKFERFDGVEQDELGVWRSPGGAQVAWFKDPDGNTLSLTQF